MKDTTEVKVGDVIRIVKSENVNMHYFPKFTLCKVVKLPNEEYGDSYEVISLYKMNIDGEEPRYFKQWVVREDFEVVL